MDNANFGNSPNTTNDGVSRSDKNSGPTEAKILKADLAFLRVCGFVNLVCAMLVVFDIFNVIFKCKNEGCGTGMSLLLALFPTIISSLCGVIIFISIQLKLKKISRNGDTAAEQLKEAKNKALISFLMLLLPIIMFVIFMLVLL